MAQKILLVNPIGKSKRSLTRRGPKMAAKKRKTRRARKAVTHRRRNPITASANPIKRRRRRHTRRNPIGSVGTVYRARRSRRVAAAGGVVNHILMPAVTAGAGALLLDVAWNNLPLPASVKTGNAQFIAKALGSIVLVTAVHKVTGNRKQAEAMGVGALTVLMHGMGRNMLKRAMPGLALGEYVDAGGSLDYDNPLDFYNTAGQGSNTVPNYPQALPAGGAVHGYDMGEYVSDMGEYVHGFDDDDIYDM